MTQVFHPGYWYQNLVPETWKKYHMFCSVQVSGTRQIWYQNARQISKVTGTRLRY